MGTLSYFANMSADGYTVDADGRFGWATPTDEVLAFINQIEEDVAVYVHGRRMYETMVYSETHDPGPDPHTTRYAEIWRGVEKVVASSSLPEEAVTSARTRLVRDLQLGGLPAMPPDARLSLRLVDTRTFANGAVYLRYVPR
ncbi:hypothetical protein [Promicromonospora sp. NPDC023805]|uniref:dihydrofolate reductase family protein n=1 Tax=Promicromonospora sp. NPDC023805 TaxID=3154696 RepID=UPI0033F6EE8C